MPFCRPHFHVHFFISLKYFPWGLTECIYESLSLNELNGSLFSMNNQLCHPRIEKCRKCKYTFTCFQKHSNYFMLSQECPKWLNTTEIDDEINDETVSSSLDAFRAVYSTAFNASCDDETVTARAFPLLSAPYLLICCIIRASLDHCNGEVITLTTMSSLQQRLPCWQPLLQPMMTKLSKWQAIYFNLVTSYETKIQADTIFIS